MLHLEVRKQSEEIAANDVEYFRIPLEIERLQMSQMIPDIQYRCDGLLERYLVTGVTG